MIIFVDIDETICTPSADYEYSLAKPIEENIKKINSVYDLGHTIIYWTARGGTTGIDWTSLTTAQLEKWGAKYTELQMRKPHYDLFICDKAINSEEFFGE